MQTITLHPQGIKMSSSFVWLLLEYAPGIAERTFARIRLRIEAERASLPPATRVGFARRGNKAQQTAGGGDKPRSARPTARQAAQWKKKGTISNDISTRTRDTSIGSSGSHVKPQIEQLRVKEQAIGRSASRLTLVATNVDASTRGAGS